MGNCETHQDVYVLDKMHTPLLGRPAIEALGLLVRVRSVEQERSPIQRFPDLFKGLGKMEGEYTIQLKEGAVPFALTNPRRVAIPLMDSVIAELQRMEKLEVISRIDEPTDWCAGMVVVPKAKKQVRICVDLTKLNENVRRETPTSSNGADPGSGRRNSSLLQVRCKFLPDQFEDFTGENTPRQSESKQYSTRLRSGQAINPPDRFDYSWNKPGEREM